MLAAWCHSACRPWQRGSVNKKLSTAQPRLLSDDEFIALSICLSAYETTLRVSSLEFHFIICVNTASTVFHILLHCYLLHCVLEIFFAYDPATQPVKFSTRLSTCYTIKDRA